MSSPTFNVITAADYYTALLEQIPAARKRVVIHSMGILWGPKSEAVLPLLHDALDRGVEVRIVGDIYSKVEANLPRLRRGDGTPRWSHTLAVNTELRAHGAHISYIGKIGFNPFKGRCHSKVTIIDNNVYTFGGVNFTSGSFANHDYMLATKNTSLTDQLYVLIREIEKDQRLVDFRESITDTSTLLFDGGTPYTSIIYDTACEIVSQAKRVYYVSQMCPSGRLAKHITATENYCYFNRPSQAEPPLSLVLPIDRLIHGITNRYKGKRYIHAKFILCENHNGTTHLLSGSNNFSWRGVAYGTKEIALHSTDPKLYQQLYHYMHHEVIGT